MTSSGSWSRSSRPPSLAGGREARTRETRRTALFYLVRTGRQWRHRPPPPAFPPWPTVYGYMRGFLRDGVWEREHPPPVRRHAARGLGTGREASPAAAIVDTRG